MASLPTRKLGKNGPEVTAMGLGLMGLSFAYLPAKPDEEKLEFLDHVYQRGETMWDSSNSYGDSEVLLGKWFKRTGKRNDIFLSTKFGNVINPDGTRYIDNSPEYIRKAIDKSLERLGTDVVDLYYCHRLNGDVPIETVVAEMVKLKEAGKCKYLGLSECSAATLRRACAVHHIDAVQMEYSPWATEIEKLGLLDAARELGVAVVAYSPLGRGFVTGRFKSHDDIPEGDFRKLTPRYSRENFPKNLELVTAIHKLAEKKGVTPGQLTLAWLMAQGNDIIPIPGTSSKKNFDENIGALKVKLTDDELKDIRRLVDEAEVVGERYPPGMAKVLFADTPPLA